MYDYLLSLRSWRGQSLQVGGAAQRAALVLAVYLTSILLAVWE
ncbi:MAG: hypothetical protein PUP92_22340 [Rhizonema sp. PD38]|nr:hypothetical protein [Rhizonema sp. PD38]